MATSSLATIWVLCGLAVVIMVIRLVLGRLCKQKFDVGDRLTVAAIVFSIARVAFTHVLVIWGTNNISDEYRDTHHFSKLDIYHREMGSKFTLVARSLYILLLWTQKFVLLEFYKKLVKDMPWAKATLICYLVIFIITFCLSIIFTFVECRPFSLYWVVIPDPGKCTEAIIQLFVVGILNMSTDLLLIALPIPILLQVHLSITKKVQLGFLFCVGFVIVIITAVRIPRTLKNPGSETFRITWTTGEFLAATFVANAPTMYSFRKRFERRKKKPFRTLASRPRDEPVRIDDFDSTAKSRTQGGAGETLVGSVDTGHT